MSRSTWRTSWRASTRGFASTASPTSSLAVTSVKYYTQPNTPPPLLPCLSPLSCSQSSLSQHEEKAAFIFCVEDRALFCRDCDEPIHVAGTLTGNHQRYLATGIRVAANAMCNKDFNDNTEPPNQGPATPAAKVPETPQTISSFMDSAWAADEFLQVYDQETGYKGSPVGYEELDWFADIGLFHDQLPKATQTAAQVPELPTTQASNTGFYRANKFPVPQASDTGFYRGNKCGTLFKKPRLEISDEEEYFTVPDLG
ncbi:B-box zinc finger protein 24 isoform X2 [Musa acuminata AAA Group]|uniref:B-box zinc finger protein 24 isoform X2 n=1 Tax=Musa acuminata AAA Group TaxID=214697 RepID=UPI0031CE23B7